jgi:hypothetical protein
MHTHTVDVFACPACKGAPELIVDGNAQLCDRAPPARLPDAVGPDPHTLGRPRCAETSRRSTGSTRSPCQHPANRIRLLETCRLLGLPSAHEEGRLTR